MDIRKKKRKLTAGTGPKKKTTLLSIVNPWDVELANVEPTNLAGRHYCSVGTLPEQPSSPTTGCRTPWPWYKPALSSQLAGSSPAQPLPARLDRASPTDAGPGMSPDVSIELSRFEDGHGGSSHQEPRGFADRTRETDVVAAAGGGPSTTNNTDNSLVSLIEQLVYSRYKSTPLVQRKFAHRRRPLALPSINRTDDSVELLDYNDLSMKGVKIVKAKENDNKNHHHRHHRHHHEVPRISRNRRLSLSMPSKLDEMEGVRIQSNEKNGSPKFRRRGSESSATFSNSGSTLNGSTLASETEDEENEEEATKVPLQSAHHSRQPGSRSNNDHHHQRHMDFPNNAHSTNSTITSVNSISSLLKEKLQWTIPQVLRSNKHENADYRLRLFVGFLFLCIIFLVGFAHVYYNQHVLQRAYFDKFRFNKNERLMHVYNSHGLEILSARLGVDIPSGAGVFSCLSEHQRPDKYCLEWLGHSRLYLGHTRRDAANCYHVTWQALGAGLQTRDCFDWSPRRGHWYGAGQIRGLAYPLEQGRLEPAAPFITGDVRRHPFGNVLKRYFLNSKGVTISVDPETPLYVSIGTGAGRNERDGQQRANDDDDDDDVELCLSARHDDFAYINHRTELPQLNYTICAADNMRSLHASMAEKFLWDGLKPDELAAVHALLSEPVWQISPTSEADVYNYTEDVIALGFLRQGHVLLGEQWQPSAGDFVLDEERFRTMRETIDVMHRRGFRIVFGLQPFISTESVNFREAVAAGLLIGERGSESRIPALTRSRGAGSVAGVLDVTNDRSLAWLRARLEALAERYHVDAFYLDLGTAHDMPHHYRCERPLANPDDYKSQLVEALLGAAVPLVGVSGAISRPRAPVFVSLPAFPSSWKAIKTVIPTVLSYGVAGYPFVMPGAVGGDLGLLPDTTGSQRQQTGGDVDGDAVADGDVQLSLPDRELYVRWLQLATFLPVIRFTHLPSKYADESVLEIAKSLTTLRQKTVTPLLKKYANITLDTGLPIIRPLWMLDPADPACHLVVDEFSVGEELIVAPILHSGSRQREVYLPAGVWKDGIDKSLRKGSRWIHNYRVAEDKVAYFVKMPDDMRF
ncbi:myogenesis-regulating glycosidase isoform X2 [Copidosoma floridanum]|uniref:myogenesis-regulating glycosidase isoform X2 n=1 Tax=Copidosoma floridanum TaxID=29053 RepID=UPI0006C960E3|nr:myogenesis-regulating glycosidase isoform X2 [Copidosoma floridanum]